MFSKEIVRGVGKRKLPKFHQASAYCPLRLDQDGNASPAPGDIEGSLDTQAGTENVKLVLNRVIGG